MRKPLAIFLLFPFLLACQNTAGDVPATDLSKPYWIYRNGDLFAADFDNDALSDLTNQDDASSLLTEMKNGTSATFMKTSDTCHACEAFSPTLRKFLKATYADVTIWKALYTNFLENRGALMNYYESLPATDEHPFLQNTPTWYSGSSTKCSLTNWGATSYSDLWKNFFKENTLLPIYRFSHYGAWEKAIAENDVLLYYYDRNDETSLTFYCDTLLPLAKASKKVTYLADVSRMNEEEKPKFQTNFGSQGVVLSYQGKSYSVTSDETKAVVTQYYT